MQNETSGGIQSSERSPATVCSEPTPVERAPLVDERRRAVREDESEADGEERANRHEQRNAHHDKDRGTGDADHGREERDGEDDAVKAGRGGRSRATCCAPSRKRLYHSRPDALFGSKSLSITVNSAAVRASLTVDSNCARTARQSGVP